MPTLICDLGGVLFTESDPQRRLEAWRSGTGGVLGDHQGGDVSDEVLAGFRTGAVSTADFALHLRERLGWTGSDEELAAGWAAGQGPVALDVLDVLSRLRDRGWRLVGAADTDPWEERARAEKFGWVLSLFDRVVTSIEVRARRPDPRFFAELRSASRQGPRLYVDDAQHNVAAARRAGLDAHLFTDAAALEAACRRLVVAVS